MPLSCVEYVKEELFLFNAFCASNCNDDTVASTPLYCVNCVV